MQQTIEENLEYVRNVVDRSERPMPIAMAAMFSVYLIVGLTAIDLRLSWSPWFMLIGMPVVVMSSVWIEKQHLKKLGVSSKRETGMNAWSQAGFALTYVLVIFMANNDHLSWRGMHSIIAILVGMHLYQSGVFGQKGIKFKFNRIMLLGLIYIAASVVMMQQQRWVWTVVAWITAVFLFSLTTIFKRSNHAQEA